MYCLNCGKELPENIRFCDNCGTPTGTNSQPQPPQQGYYTPAAPNQPPQQPYYSPAAPYQQPQQPYYPTPNLQNQPPKKKGSPLLPILLSVAVVLVVAIVLLVVFVVLPMFDSNGDNDRSSPSVESTVSIISEEETSLPEEKPSSAVEEIPSSEEIASEPEVALPTVNPDYEDIFLSRYIIDMPSLFFGLESDAFAIVTDEGIIEKLEFGYDGDVVKEMVDTIYFPFADYTDDQKAETENALKEAYAGIAAIDFCTADYQMLGDYYRITFTFKGLDNADHVQVLSDVGMISTANVDYISMKASEEGLLSTGYVKR